LRASRSSLVRCPSRSKGSRPRLVRNRARFGSPWLHLARYGARFEGATARLVSIERPVEGSRAGLVPDESRQWISRPRPFRTQSRSRSSRVGLAATRWGFASSWAWSAHYKRQVGRSWPRHVASGPLKEAAPTRHALFRARRSCFGSCCVRCQSAGKRIQSNWRRSQAIGRNILGCRIASRRPSK
jgi:hypothetical protein